MDTMNTQEQRSLWNHQKLLFKEACLEAAATWLKKQSASPDQQYFLYYCPFHLGFWVGTQGDDLPRTDLQQAFVLPKDTCVTVGQAASWLFERLSSLPVIAPAASWHDAELYRLRFNQVGLQPGG